MGLASVLSVLASVFPRLCVGREVVAVHRPLARPGHAGYEGTAVPHDRGRRDKPGDDHCELINANQ